MNIQTITSQAGEKRINSRVIIKKLSARFKGLDDMESRIQVYCLDIAKEINATFMEVGESLVFVENFIDGTMIFDPDKVQKALSS